jgi:predicted amidophosphoribosyltransferase
MCRCCGLSLDYDERDQAVCGDCARRDPLFGRARSAMVYNDSSRRLVLAFKHADRIDAEPAWAALLADADLLVPSPLHSRR